MIVCQLELEIKRNLLKNPGVHNLNSKNTVIGKTKAEIYYRTKERLINITVLKMIARQKTNKKLKLED